MTIEEVLAFEKMQIFDRKSVNIEPKALAIPLIAFANADGGTVAIGISDKTRRIEGVDYDIQRLNELLRVPFDFCIPTVKIEIEKVSCVDYKGRGNYVLLMHVEPSMQVQAIVRNSSMIDKKQLFGEENHGLVHEKPVFGEENHGLAIEKPWFELKKPLFQVIDHAVCSKALTPIIAGNVKKVVETFDFNQIFGRKEIKKALGYGDEKAGKAIEAMQLLKIVVPVEGKGKGKYILKGSHR